MRVRRVLLTLAALSFIHHSLQRSLVSAATPNSPEKAANGLYHSQGQGDVLHEDILASREAQPVNVYPIRRGYTSLGKFLVAGIPPAITRREDWSLLCFSNQKQVETALDDVRRTEISYSANEAENVFSGRPICPVDVWQQLGMVDLATLIVGGNGFSFYPVITAYIIYIKSSRTSQGDEEVGATYDALYSHVRINNIKPTMHQATHKPCTGYLRLFIMCYPSYFNPGSLYCGDVALSVRAAKHNSAPASEGPITRRHNSELPVKPNYPAVGLIAISEIVVGLMDGVHPSLLIPPPVAFIALDVALGKYSYGVDVHEPDNTAWTSGPIQSCEMTLFSLYCQLLPGTTGTENQ
ncbi:MAG: hypothetical protein Q9163_001292 [Psora crenata]